MSVSGECESTECGVGCGCCSEIADTDTAGTDAGIGTDTGTAGGRGDRGTERVGRGRERGSAEGICDDPVTDPFIPSLFIVGPFSWDSPPRTDVLVSFVQNISSPFLLKTWKTCVTMVKIYIGMRI